MIRTFMIVAASAAVFTLSPAAFCQDHGTPEQVSFVTKAGDQGCGVGYYK